jgi:hypothetical protein
MDMSYGPRSPKRIAAGAGYLLLMSAWGCTGSIGEGGAGPVGPAGPGPGGMTVPGPGPAAPVGPGSSCAVVDPGPSPLRRLTRVEYDNTVRMLLGTSAKLGAELFPRDEEQFGFDNSAEGRGLNGALAEGYLRAAERLAREAVTRLPMLLPCDPASKSEAVCLDELLDGFGARAWRRPLEPGEKENLRQVFATGKKNAAAGSFADGVDAVIQVMLLSPQFLYRDERGVAEPGKSYLRLTSWEIASRLSYLVWGSMPDDELFKAAREGRLSSREQIAVQARRMLGDPRAVDMMTNFYGQWLQLQQLDSLTKDEAAFPKFNETIAGLMRRETESLVQHVVETGGKLDTLFTAPYTFANAQLAGYYGLKGPTGPDFQKVEIDPAQRAGIVTQGGFLSSHATPEPGLTALIFRGVFVRASLLCEPLPEPPPEAAEMSPPVTPTTTPRSWSKERMEIAACGTCHSLFDPIGYGFEGFDEIGLPRDKPADTSGEVRGTDVAGPFNGPVELARKLAGSRQAADCLATQWFRFAHGRMEDTSRDSCSLDGLREAFFKSGGDLKELLVALTQTDAFLLRSKGDAP